jgi:RNA polymerase sigma factor (TIGR02999 family)
MDLPGDIDPTESGHEGEKLETLMARAYSELRRVAQGYFSRERADHTLQPTALVHEVYLRLVRNENLPPALQRKQFFFEAGRAMRQILVEHARRKRGPRRGGRLTRHPIDDTLEFYQTQQIDVIALNDALESLAKLDERQALIVELRVLYGYTTAEVAELLEVGVATVEREYRKARTFLYGMLGPDPQP